MGKKTIRRIRANRCLIIFLCLLITYTGGSADKIFNNVNVYSKKQITDFINRGVPPDVKITLPPGGIFPHGGTVSHHLLISTVINAWFKELKQLRDVKIFIIISPNHYRSGNSNISLSYYGWQTAGRVTKVNKNIVGSILRSLDIKEDNIAFYNEHGIEAMLPFISHYYPEAEIVPILVDEKSKNGRLIIKLADEICRIMQTHKDIFLLISTDFSHGYGRKGTDINDAKSHRSLISLSFNPARPCSDNTTGLMILYRVCESLKIKNTHIFCHTDAEKYTLEKQGNNITSYFFTYQY